MSKFHANLVESYKKSPSETKTYLVEAIQKKELKFSDFSLAELFESCFGWQAFRDCRNDGPHAKSVLATKLMEAAGGVSTAAFANISGQIVYSAILEAYESEQFQFSKLFPTVSTKFSGEKIAGIQRIGDKALEVGEGEAYPLVGVGEDYIQTPATTKRGMIVPVTREAIFFDRTGVLLDRCREVGEFLGLNKEKRAIDCFIDGNAGAKSAMDKGHRYHWVGTSYATYQSSTPWINLKTSNGLTDYRQIEQAELLAANMTDPYTGEPIMWDMDTIVVCPELEHTAKATQAATNTLHVGGYATSGNLLARNGPNTLKQRNIVVSRLLKARLSADSQQTSNWYLCNPAKMARYMENFPMQTIEAPTNSHDEFHKDIVAQFRADEMGAYATFEPRASIKNTA